MRIRMLRKARDHRMATTMEQMDRRVTEGNRTVLMRVLGSNQAKVAIRTRVQANFY